MIFQTIIKDNFLELEYSDLLNQLLIKSKKHINFDCVQLSNNSLSIIINNKSFYLTINPNMNGYEVAVNHHVHLVQVKDEIDILLNQFGVGIEKEVSHGIVKAQIPGLVGRIFVKVGDRIKKNQKLFILEAMKMENEIDSHIDGTVYKIYCQEGESVEKGTIIMEFNS